MSWLYGAYLRGYGPKLNIIKCAQSLYAASVVLLGHICIQEQLGYYLKIRHIIVVHTQFYCKIFVNILVCVFYSEFAIVRDCS